MKNINKKNFKQLLFAALFACFAFNNNVQAMLFDPMIDLLIELQQEQLQQEQLQQEQLQQEQEKVAKDNCFFNLKESELSVFPDDVLKLIIKKTLKQGIISKKIALVCQRFCALTQDVIKNPFCNQVELKIENNDPNFDQWFNQFHKNIQNQLKKRLDQIAKNYVDTKTEDELNELPCTIFKRIFVNKWFWIKDNQQRFLNNTIHGNFNIDEFNQKINNLNKNCLILQNKCITKNCLILQNKSITDEMLELILEIIIKKGRAPKITKLYLPNNRLTTLPNSIGNLYQLQELDLSNNQLTYETKQWLIEKFVNRANRFGQPALRIYN